MFCPNCGANNLTEQKFCRSCGLNLKKIAESFLEQLPNAESAIFLKHSRLLEKFGTVALGGFLTVLLVGVSFLSFTVFNKYVLTGENVLFGLFIISLIIFACLSLVYVFFNEVMKEKKAKVNPVLQKEIEKRDTSKLLEEKPFIPAQSITENSTEFFPIENETKKL